MRRGKGLECVSWWVQKRKLLTQIGMVDAEGYPKAFIETENLRLEFSRAAFKSGYILADVKIMPKSNKEG